ncbi:MAG: hypothetical protein H0Z38_08885 [Firmicutes bacterium]|nr:hypothetical protein [Bacillota bacterium]
MRTDSRIVSVEGRQLKLTNLSKHLWPNYTKAQFIEYYTLAAPYLLPYLKDRPISLVRYPDGIEGKFFYQKDKPPGTPEWVQTFPVQSQDSDRVIEYILINDLPTLIWVANLAAIELNPWHSRYTSLDNPDWAVIDLDPAEPAGFSEAKKAALLTKEVLDHLEIAAYPKISGATGIHIYFRLPKGFTYRESADLVGFIGKLLLKLDPDLITTERLVKKRTGKVYVDHLQNLRGQTIVAPYSLRPRPQAPISMPFSWSELETATPEDYNLGSFTEGKRPESTGFEKILKPLSSTASAKIKHLSELVTSAEIANI